MHYFYILFLFKQDMQDYKRQKCQWKESCASVMLKSKYWDRNKIRTISNLYYMILSSGLSIYICLRMQTAQP